MSIWKRNAVVAAIVLFVCAAVYLNWSYGEADSVMGGGPALESGKTLGEASLVSTDTALEIPGDTVEDVLGEEAQTEAVIAEEDDFARDALGEQELAAGTYFDTARLNREEARDSALTMLQETVDDPAANAEAVSAASESITAMAGAALKESSIESLITAKGYRDCVAFIGENSVSVVVASADGTDLQPGDVARVTDIVCGETDFTASNVKVIQAEE